MTDPDAPKNPSKFNTGLVDLPPAHPAFIWYPYAASAEFPAMGSGGRNAMAGPVFYFDAARKHNILPAEDDRTLITYDWMRNKAWKVKLDENERIVKMDPLLDGLMHPIDMDIAPDGALYLLEYGSEWYFNKNGRLRRIIPGEKNGASTIAIKDAGPDTYQATASEGTSVQWFATVGDADEKVGDGPLITFSRKDARELRAIATGKDGRNAIARRTFDTNALPPLTLRLIGAPAAARFGSELAYEIDGAPEPAKITIRARYIPTTGHDSGGPQLPDEIRKLLTDRQCLACHQIDIPSVGPRYLDVAMRYRDDKTALDTLRKKLKTGGSGVWGEIPMPPQAAVTDDEAARAIQAILALATGIAEKRGTAKGSVLLPSAPANAAPGGSWEVIAEAPGTTAAKTRIAAE
jgi:cytochrome c